MGGFDGFSRLTAPIVFERKQLVSLKREQRTRKRYDASRWILWGRVALKLLWMGMLSSLFPPTAGLPGGA